MCLERLEDLRTKGFRVVHLVPKAGAETLTEYDTMAQEAAQRRRVAAAANPLAKRAIAWPSSVMSDGKAPLGAQTLSTPAPSAKDDWTTNIWRQPH